MNKEDNRWATYDEAISILKDELGDRRKIIIHKYNCSNNGSSFLARFYIEATQEIKKIMGDVVKSAYIEIRNFSFIPEDLIFTPKVSRKNLEYCIEEIKETEEIIKLAEETGYFNFDEKEIVIVFNNDHIVTINGGEDSCLYSPKFYSLEVF